MTTPPVRRINLRIYLTLRPEAREALVYLGATKGTQSAITSDALEALACARGWRPDPQPSHPALARSHLRR